MSGTNHWSKRPARVAMSTIEQLIDDFGFLDDWEDRYRYLIELGQALPEFDEAKRTPDNKVRGCVSQVWLATDIKPTPEGEPVLTFTGDSDAHIVRGLVAVLIALYSGRTVSQVIDTDAQAVLARIGLDEHLTPQRSNGLAAMVARIKRDAQAAKVETAH